MANTLTNLIPDAYAALDVVSRELVGFIPSVARDSSTDAVASGQNVRAHQTRANSAGKDITPAMTLPAAADQTVDNVAVAITKLRAFPFSWSGEEQYAINQGPGFLSVRQDQIAQAIRAAVNEIEVDLAVAAALGGSRGKSPADTTLFKTNLADAAQVRKILDDNGAPASGRSLIIDTSTGAALRTLSQLTKANEAGSSMTLRDGELLNIHGMSIKESAQIVTPAVGTTTTAVLASTATTVGQTTFTLKAAGTGTIKAGDLVTIGAGDANKYVVTSDIAAVSGATLTIAKPGLLVAQGAAEHAVTVTASSARNVAFSQNAILLATRLPISPPEGDLAIDSEIVTDPRSGLPSGRLIEEQLRRLMRASGWAFMDLKINHFDAFRDVYGFVAGDEALRFTAMLVSELVDELGTPDDFIGHPGGENFVIISTDETAKLIAQRLKERFATEAKSHYSFVDRDRGQAVRVLRCACRRIRRGEVER